MMINKKALVLSGGGSKGAYQVGVLKHLSKNHKFDIICGSSVGAINASFLAQYSKEDFEKACDDLKDFWHNLEQKDVYKRWFPFGKIHALWKQSLYNSKPLKSLIYKVLDTTKIKTSNVILKIGTVSVDTGNYKEYDKNSKNIKDAITASASFPPFFMPIKINNELEYDAGLREYTPIKSAIDAGATEIYIICSDPKELTLIKDSEKLKTFGIFQRFIYTMASEVIQNDLKKIDDINQKVLSGMRSDKKYIKCHLIIPQKELISDSMNFNHEVIVKLIQLGYTDAVNQIK